MEERVSSFRQSPLIGLTVESRFRIIPVAFAVALFLGGCATQHTASNRSPASTDVAAAQPIFWDPSDSDPSRDESAKVSSAADLWDRIRAGFELDDNLHRPSVEHWITFYSTRSDMLQRDLRRGEPFLWRIVQNVDKRGMPMELVLLPEVESAYDPFARSDGSAATGLWQFIPGTAARFGLRHNWWYDGRRDILRSTDAALNYLQYLGKMFHGDWLLALAAYNSGEGTVQRAIAHNVSRGLPTDFWHLTLPRETEQYVPKLLALASLVDQPQRYGINLPDAPNASQLQVVKLPGQIDFALAAKLAGISVQSLRDLNPGFRRWATDPDGIHRLLLPRYCASKFERKLANVPPRKLVTWHRHVIHRGETLSRIAVGYNTTTAILKRINHLHGNLIRSGNTLLIPVAQTGTNAARIAMVSEGENGHRSHPIATHYTVRSGDSLWRIAQHLHVPLKSLRRWNGLQSHSVIKPGERLTIRGDSAATEVGGHSSSKTYRQRVAEHYTVTRGDSLWSIARHFGVGVKKLRAWNALASDAILKPGQELKILSRSGNLYYRVQKGDSLSGIAHRYSVSVSDLRRWNDLSKGHYLQPGQRLKIVVDSDTSDGRGQT